MIARTQYVPRKINDLRGKHENTKTLPFVIRSSKRWSPGDPRELQTLVGRMADENRLWGQKRIQTELAGLGFEVSARTVAKFMRVCRSRGPSGAWREFLTRHASDIWACGFFCVPTILFQTLHVFFVIRLANREIRKIAARHLCSAGYTIFTGLLHDAFLRPAGILGMVQPGLHQFGGSQSVGTRIVFVG